MKRIVFSIAAVLVATTAAAQLEVKELKLSNGMSVWLNEDHSQPKVFGAVVVRAGAKDCPNTGIAHYFEHIMFKGTDRLGTIDYAAEKPLLDSISAQYDLLSQTKDDAERSRIQLKINELSVKAAHNEFLPHFIEQWCWLNSERLMTPVYRGFQGELENVYEEKNRSSDGMGDAMEKVMGAVFKTQPYAYPIIGSTESLKNPRLSDMAEFYKKYYVASNMCLVLCGDITPSDELTALLEKTFGRVQTGPVPQRGYSPMPEIQAGERQEITLPIPLIGAEVLVFKGATDYEPDANALELANGLLSNGKAGLLDSLMNEHKVMASLALNVGFDDAAGTAVLIIPKLLGKMKTAEERVMEQVKQVMEGNFSDSQLEALKQEMVMSAEKKLETIDDRSELLIDLFSKGKTWQDALDKIESIKRLTKADVVAAAKKYYGANYITLVKKYGTPNKETLKQPGYKPISPKNTDAKSDFARQLEQMPVNQVDIRTVDLQTAADTKQLNDHVTLYYKKNPINDIFTFNLRFKDGKLHTPALDVLSSYLSSLGTDSLKKQQLEKAWQQINTTMGINAGNNTFVKGDDEALKDAKDADKVDRKSFGKQKDDVLAPMRELVMYGSKSTFLNQLSKKEIKALKNEDLLSLFRELQQYDCELLYCGTKSIDDVAAAAQQALPLSQCSRKAADTFRPLQQYTEPTVYFYNVPKSRQNYVVSYDAIGALPTAQYSSRMYASSARWPTALAAVLMAPVWHSILRPFWATSQPLAPRPTRLWKHSPQ